MSNSAKDTREGVMDALGNVAQGAEDLVKEVVTEVMDAAENVEDAFGGITNSDSGLVDVINGGSKYELNKENQWGWITLYVVTIVLAILLNLLFIVGGLCTRRTRTTGYYLLLNLSLRDILVAALCVPFTLDSEIIALTWNYGDEYCIAYRFFYHCFLALLPFTLLFLAFHLFVENCKWNFAGEGGSVPRPWPHTIYLPLIWFFSAAYAVPTVFLSAVRDETDDIYRNDIARRASSAKVCMHIGGDDGKDLESSSYFYYVISTLLTFVLPVILLFIPWWALLVQACGCCTRKLASSEFWLSIITLFLILFYEASRAPYELFNIHHIMTNWKVESGLVPFDLDAFIPGLDGESYKAVMKWAVYAPALLHPLVYFAFSPEARHGVNVLFRRCCSCCCSKSGDDVEMASDDEKGRMLGNDKNNVMAGGDAADVPLQSKQEEEM